MAGRELVIATGNPHKVRELREIFAAVGLEVRSLADLEAGGEGPFIEPTESGATFEQNATIKAVAYARQCGRMCLADDSGLEVDALGGAPGVISSHYCTDGREAGMDRAERDRRNNERLLRELAGVPPARRAARFVCVMVAAEARRPVAMTRGTFEGRIGLPGPAEAGGVPRGDNGFGYDPLVLVAPEFVRTSAELPPEEKNAMSHRGKAAREMALELARLLSSRPHRPTTADRDRDAGRP